MDGAAPKAKLHPPRKACAPCAHDVEGSRASARHWGKEPQMFVVVSGVNVEGEGGASMLGEGPEGCIGGGTAGRGTAGIRSGLAPITCFFWMKNRNSETQLGKRALADDRCQFSARPCAQIHPVRLSPAWETRLQVKNEGNHF